MAENIETRISSEQAKEAIYKINKLSEKGMTPEQIADAIEKVSQINSSASEIDGSVNKNTDFINYIKGCDSVAYVGDSISVGAYVDSQENVSSFKIKNDILNICNSKNVGFISAYSNYQAFSIFHRHSTLGTWEIDVLDNESLNGVVIKSNIPTNSITFSSGAAYQTKAKIHYKKQLASFSFEVYVNDVLVDTISESASTYTIAETPYYNILPTSKNDIKIVVLSGMVEISGITYIENENDLLFDILATGGRRTSYPFIDAITQISNNYDAVIWALGFNDLSSTNDYHQGKINDNFEELFTNIKAQNKYFVYLNYGWNTNTVDNWYMEKIDDAMVDYDKYIKIDVASMIQDNEGTKATAEYRYNILKDWRVNDSAHPNENGQLAIYNIIKSALSLNKKENPIFVVERPYLQLVNTYSLSIGTGVNQLLIEKSFELKHYNHTEVVVHISHWDIDGFASIGIRGSEGKIIIDHSIEMLNSSNLNLGFSRSFSDGIIALNRADALNGNTPFILRLRYFN